MRVEQEALLNEQNAERQEKFAFDDMHFRRITNRITGERGSKTAAIQEQAIIKRGSTPVSSHSKWKQQQEN